MISLALCYKKQAWFLPLNDIWDTTILLALVIMHVALLVWDFSFPTIRPECMIALTLLIWRLNFQVVFFSRYLSSNNLRVLISSSSLENGILPAYSINSCKPAKFQGLHFMHSLSLAVVNLLFHILVNYS